MIHELESQINNKNNNNNNNNNNTSNDFVAVEVCFVALQRLCFSAMSNTNDVTNNNASHEIAIASFRKLLELRHLIQSFETIINNNNNESEKRSNCNKFMDLFLFKVLRSSIYVETLARLFNDNVGASFEIIFGIITTNKNNDNHINSSNNNKREGEESLSETVFFVNQVVIPFLTLLSTTYTNEIDTNNSNNNTNNNKVSNFEFLCSKQRIATNLFDPQSISSGNECGADQKQNNNNNNNNDNNNDNNKSEGNFESVDTRAKWIVKNMNAMMQNGNNE